MKVSVIGGAGHVGIPFSIVVATAGHSVTAVDPNTSANQLLNRGILPFIEHDAEHLLHAAVSDGSLTFTDDYSSLATADVVAITLGTPVDGENNPRLDIITDFFETRLAPSLSVECGKLIILRSTVAPGTTELLRKELEARTGLQEGHDFHLVFCPERVAQTKGIVESGSLPQLIGAFSLESYLHAAEFFQTFVHTECFHLKPREAEIGKLITNMYRYIEFAIANEFYVIGDQHKVNIHKVIQACNYNYPRMNLPLPGPNVGGPCLFKDGRFLTSKILFPDLINTSFQINEGMPRYILDKALTMRPVHEIKKIGILGMAFKADCDDTRQSLSFKLKKNIRQEGFPCVWYDPFVDGGNDASDMKDCDIVFLMTPHTCFKSFDDPMTLKDGALIVDVWKHLERSKRTVDGFYTNTQ